MIKTALSLLNGNEIFKQNLPAIIEVFVQYYGEENRSYIEERFNNLIPICFSKPSERDSIINKTLSELQESFYKPFIEKYGIEDPSVYLPSNLMQDGYSILERYHAYTERVNTPQEIKYNETVEYVMNTLKNRYGITLTFEQLKAKKGTQVLDDFISKLPGYIAPQLKSVLEDEYHDVEEQRIKENLVSIMQKVNPDLTVEKFDEMWANKEQSELSRIEAMYKDYLEIRRQFFEEIKPLEPHIEYTKKCHQLLEEAKQKNHIKFILDNSSLFPAEEIETLKEMIESKKPIDFDRIPTILTYCGKSLYMPPTIDGFNTESEEILENDPSNWKAVIIQRDRINFYKLHGIDLGNEYEAYERSPEAQAVKPETSEIDKFLELRQKATERINIDYYGSLPDFVQTQEQIAAANLECKDHGYDENTFENTVMCVCPNYKLIDGVPVVAPLGVFRMNIYSLDGLDAFIMHELNHVYELHYLSDNEEYAEFSCGWDIVHQEKTKGVVTSLKEDKTKRDYELFNEIVNELLSQDICRILHENGIYLFSHKEDAKISGKTSYEGSMFIIRDFYNTYLEDIKASRRTYDMSQLFAKVGEENFNELNELFHVYYETFPNDFMVYQAQKDYRDGKDTEKVRAYVSIVEKKDIIMAKMQKHAEEYAMQHESLAG